MNNVSCKQERRLFVGEADIQYYLRLTPNLSGSVTNTQIKMI